MPPNGQLLPDTWGVQLTPESPHAALPHQVMAAIKRGGDFCAAFACHNRRNKCKISFFRFPKDPQRYVESTYVYLISYPNL